VQARRAALLVLAAVIATLAPAAANATTYCVSDPTCVAGGGTAQPDLGTAMSTATTNPGADRIELGAGTFDEAAGPPLLQFFYSNPDPLDIVGAGIDQTVLTDSAAVTNEFVLFLGNAASTVSDLTVRMTTTNERGLDLITGATATGVEADQAGTPNNLVGVTINGGGALRSSQVNLQPGMSPAVNVGVHVLGAQSTFATVEDLTVSGGVGVLSDSPAAYRRLDMVVANTGFQVSIANPTLDSSLIRTTAANSHGFDVLNTNNIAVPFGLTARNLTLIGPGASSIGASVFAAGVPGQAPAITLRDSILSGFGTTAICSAVSPGTATLTTDHSNYPPASVDPSCSLTETAHTAAPPGFVDSAANDYHLLASSPLIEAGTSFPLAPGESPTDLDGNPRLADANGDCVAARDLGAYEAPGVAAACPQAGGGTGATAPTAAAPETFKSRLQLKYDRSAGQFVGRLSSAETDCRRGRTVKILRRDAGRTEKVGKTKTKASGRFSLKREADPGTYFAKVAAKKLSDGDTCTAARSKKLNLG
jgi:hypothetical protein